MKALGSGLLSDEDTAVGQGLIRCDGDVWFVCAVPFTHGVLVSALASPCSSAPGILVWVIHMTVTLPVDETHLHFSGGPDLWILRPKGCWDVNTAGWMAFSCCPHV